MIYNKWFKGNEKNNDLQELKNKYKKDFLEADFRNPFSFNLVVYDGKEPIGFGRMEMKSGLFVIVGLGVEDEQKNPETMDLMIRLIIRKVSEVGGQGVYVKITDDQTVLKDLYIQLGFAPANKNFHEENTYYRHGDIHGDCSEDEEQNVDMEQKTPKEKSKKPFKRNSKGRRNGKKKQ